MQIALLRVGVDTGCGGILGPVFADDSFEYVPIPDRSGSNRLTYGNTCGRLGKPLVEYFPAMRRFELSRQSIHLDPEFETFTYGDPTPPKSGLRKLTGGDMLVFYAGLKGWERCQSDPALYIIGFFEVACAGLASTFSRSELKALFANNFHVKHRAVFEDQKARLVLVKGTPKSRLLKKAVKISTTGRDKGGRPLHVLSLEMQAIFGGFGGNTSIQRCPPRWVAPEFISGAAKFVRRLR